MDGPVQELDGWQWLVKEKLSGICEPERLRGQDIINSGAASQTGLLEAWPPAPGSYHKHKSF